MPHELGGMRSEIITPKERLLDARMQVDEVLPLTAIPLPKGLPYHRKRAAMWHADSKPGLWHVAYVRAVEVGEGEDVRFLLHETNHYAQRT